MVLTSRSRQSLRLQSRFAPSYAIINATLQSLAESVLQPTILLAAVAFLLGGTNYQIAAFAVIALATWALAPVLLLILQSVIGRPYTIVFSAAIVRLAAVLVVGVIGFRIDDISTQRIVGSLIVAYLAYQIASSVAGQASAGLILSSGHRTRQDATFRRRSLAAIVAAIVGALVCWSVFRSDQAFQDSIGILLLLAALSVASASWFLLNIPGGPARSPSPRPALLWSSIWRAFQTAPFRRFISFKVLLALAAAVDPFLIVYGFQELGFQVQYLGLALVAYAAGQLVGYLFWPRWIARHSPRVPFQIAAFLRLLLLTLVIALPALATSNLYTDRFDDQTMAMRGFAIAFVLLGLAGSVGNAANQRYMMDIAPRGATQGPILAANLVAAVCAFGPFGVAWLMQRHELERILWGAIGVAILALLASGLLIDSRVRVRTTVGSWRSRRQAPKAA